MRTRVIRVVGTNEPNRSWHHSGTNVTATMKHVGAVLCVLAIISGSCATDPESRPPGSLPAATAATEPSTPTGAQFDSEDQAIPRETLPEASIDTAVPTITTAAAMADPPKSVTGDDSAEGTAPESEVPQSDPADTSGTDLDAGEPEAEAEVPPPTAEELVRQRWFDMEIPKPSESVLEALGDTGELEVVRHAGSDLYATSTGIASYAVGLAGGHSPQVVLAPGERWQEAVIGAAAAGRLGAPLVLVPPEGLRDEAIFLLQSADVRKALLVGNFEEVNEHLLATLAEFGIAVEHQTGPDASATAAAVADHVRVDAGSARSGDAVVVVSDAEPATAIAAAPLAAFGSLPLLITPAGELHPSTAGFIADNEISRVLLVGSATGFSPEVALAIEAAGADVVRVVGETPQDLARAAAGYFEEAHAQDSRCIAGPKQFAFARADDPLMSLAAVPLLAQACTPLLFADAGSLSPQTRNDIYLARHRPGGVQVHVFADTERIPDSTVDITLPPIRLAFPVTDPTLAGAHNTMAVIDEQRQVTLYLQDEGFRGINWLAWSPNAPRLAFAATQDETAGLFLLEPDAGTTRRLTPPDEHFAFSTWASPGWSPDGTRIALSAYVGGESHREPGADLYVVDVASGQLEEVSVTDLQDHFLKWTPDSRHVLYLRHDQFGTPLGIHTLRENAFLADVFEGTSTQLRLDGRALLSASWSPDGGYFAFELTEADIDDNHLWGTGTPRVFVAPKIQLPYAVAVEGISDGGLFWWSPDGGWSTDGTRLAFSRIVSVDGETESRIAMYDIGSRGLTDLTGQDTDPGSRFRYVGWSPIGSTLALRFHGNDTQDASGLYLLDPTSHVSVLVNDSLPQGAYRPFGFSPEGSQIGNVVFTGGTGLIVATDTSEDGAERLLLDATEYTGYPRDRSADLRMRWDEFGLSGTIEWYADY